MSNTNSRPQLVDTLQPVVVLNAASARLNRVKDMQRATVGAAHISLAEVVRQALNKWVMSAESPVPIQTNSVYDTCPTCRRLINVKSDGTFRKHGPAKTPCTGGTSDKRNSVALAETKPFRFKMPPDLYAGIKATIVKRNYSVSQVITHLLVRFAETGEY